MVFIATFNNISVISWRSVLLTEEVPGENDQLTNCIYMMLYRVHFVIYLINLNKQNMDDRGQNLMNSKTNRSVSNSYLVHRLLKTRF